MSESEQNNNEEQEPRTPKGGGLFGWFRRLRAGWSAYLDDLSHKPGTRFLTILWAVCIIFLGISILSAANPFLLLYPGGVFAVPFQDTRPTVEFQGVDRKTGNLVSYKRRMDPGESLETAVRRLTFLVSEPVGLREGLSGGETYADLEPLPRLGFAVRQVWFRGAESGQLVIDLRRNTLIKETSLFHKNRHRASVVPAEQSREEDDDDDEDKKEKKKKKKRNKKSEQIALAGYLDLYFRSLTGTIFASQSDVKSVLYLLDGQPETIDEMKFDLDIRYTRP